MNLVIKDDLVEEVLSSRVTASWVTSNFNLEDYRGEKKERTYQGELLLEGTYTKEQLLEHVSSCFSKYKGEVVLEVDQHYSGIDLEFHSIIYRPETDKEVVSEIQRLVNLRKRAVTRYRRELVDMESLQQQEKDLLAQLKEKYPDN